jgi:hypothetical protein
MFGSACKRSLAWPPPGSARVIAFLSWLGFVLARLKVWAKGHLTLFILLGSGRTDTRTRGSCRRV